MSIPTYTKGNSNLEKDSLTARFKLNKARIFSTTISQAASKAHVIVMLAGRSVGSTIFMAIVLLRGL